MTDFNELCLLIENSKRSEDILVFMRERKKQRELIETTCGPQQKTSLNCPMCKAARKGYVDVVKALVDAGFDPRSQCLEVINCFDSGETPVRCDPVHLACHYGHLSLAKTLIEQYAVDVNTPDRHGKPLLLYAIDSADADPEARASLVKYLVDSGADFRQCYFIIQNTPLHYAAKYGQASVCDILVRRGANCNVKNTVDMSPLQLAVRSGDAPSARVLLNAGAHLDINQTSSKGESVLFHAVLNGHVEMVKLLCSLGAYPDKPQNGKEGLLLQALLTYYHASAKDMKKSLFEIIRYLIVDANVEIRDDESGCSSLFKLVIENLDADIGTLMVKAGHRLNQQDMNYMDSYDSNHNTEAYQFCMDLVKNYSQPQTLSDICVFRIRRLMGTRLLQGVEKLLLPKTLKDIVLLKHIPF